MEYFVKDQFIRVSLTILLNEILIKKRKKLLLLCKHASTKYKFAIFGLVETWILSRPHYKYSFV